MDRKRFGEIMLWLEAVYGRGFGEEGRKAAWGLLHTHPNELVGDAARLMVDEGETAPSSAAWLRRVKAIQTERRQVEQMQLMRDKLDGLRQLPHTSESSGYEEFKNALATLGGIGTRAPTYPGMGLTEILAVRHLEKAGIAHDEAYKTVREGMLRRTTTTSKSG